MKPKKVDVDLGPKTFHRKVGKKKVDISFQTFSVCVAPQPVS